MQQIADFPNVVGGIQKQTVWVDFGAFLPAGVTLTGTPTLTLTSAADDAAQSRVSIQPVVGTIPKAQKGTGIANTAIIAQLMLPALSCDTKYKLVWSCSRSDNGDNADIVAAFNHITAEAPN